ncbi:hypothetical protein MAPG_03539 [Magnaporthiopsis poae ATCC 64411]|uniref:GST N-terminal domain-containing protein n=1 Tax=Magnaporthiopsis poae (strain ATCC 64411 / 73-15) TaxID=644358 RepID=A0A0C4DUA2_MAGP6|nr:hypothetical protein MAPG_03539 [Magnaporthiopsis poae ATCC 64411]
MAKITFYRGDGSAAMTGHLLLSYLGAPYSSVHMVPMVLSGMDQSKAANTGGYEAVDGTLPHEEYLKINPTGFVPALKIEEEGRTTVITEVPAVVTYLASLADTVPHATASGGPGPNYLLGRSALERAKVYEWLGSKNNYAKQTTSRQPLVHLGALEGAAPEQVTTAGTSVITVVRPSSSILRAGTLHGIALVEISRPYRLVGEGEAAAAAALKKKGMEILEECYARVEQRIRDGDLGIGGGKDGYFTAVDFNLYVFWRIGALRLGTISGESHPHYAALMRKVEALEATRRVLEVEGNAALSFKP